MNKQQQPTTAAPTDNTQLIQKLRSEYISLKERVNSMNAFLLDIDFDRRVPDPEEQRLMQEKYSSMLNYLMNLRRCIMYYERKQLEKIVNDQAGIDSISKDGMGYLLATLKDGRTLDLRKINISENAAAIILADKDPSLLDDVDVKAACDELGKAWNAYRERQHDLDTNHCGQDAHDPCGELGTEGNPIPLPSPVGDGSAAVPLKDLLGMEVIKIVRPGNTLCDTCPLENYGAPCVKVELVGGIYLCLAAHPNSIVTE